MVHAPQMLGRRFGHPVAAPVPLTPPMTPARYIALRRRAARLTVDEVAERLTSKAADQAEIRQLVRTLETHGITARHVETLDLLRDAFPIDPDVYFQLMHDSADRYPRICSGCGCSKYDPCGHADNDECRWADDAGTICTRCTGGEYL